MQYIMANRQEGYVAVFSTLILLNFGLRYPIWILRSHFLISVTFPSLFGTTKSERASERVMVVQTAK